MASSAPILVQEKLLVSPCSSCGCISGPLLPLHVLLITPFKPLLVLTGPLPPMPPLSCSFPASEWPRTLYLSGM